MGDTHFHESAPVKAEKRDERTAHDSGMHDDEGGGEPLLLTAPHGAYDGFPYPLHRLIHRLLISCAMAVLPGNEEFIRIFPRWESPAFERPEADLAEIIRDYRRGKWKKDAACIICPLQR